MATKGSMKGFYRQKKNSGIAKPSSKKSTAKPHASSTLGSDVTQPPALFSHGSPDLQDDYDEREELLRQFDLNMAYGPCAGMSRLARWERASKLGMNPPEEIGGLLKTTNVRSQCLVTIMSASKFPTELEGTSGDLLLSDVIVISFIRKLKECFNALHFFQNYTLALVLFAGVLYAGAKMYSPK